MRAGLLDRRITIEYKVVAQEAVYGTETITWTALAANIPAQVTDIPPSRSESVQQGLAVARNQTRIRLRWRSDIDSSMRIVVHGDTDITYQIIGGPAEVMGRKQMVELVCERYST